MSLFEHVYTQETAPEGSRPTLDKVFERFGMIPNLMGKMAESPAAAKGYATLSGILAADSSFSPVEQQLLLLTTSRINGCDYCVAAHTMAAGRAKMPEDVVQAIRDDTPIADPRLSALRAYCTKVVENRGWTSEAEQQAFLDAGFTKAQILEVILAVGVKTISNYVNHVTEPTLDKHLEGARWSRDQAA